MTDILGLPPAQLPPPITTSDEALAWAEELVQTVETKRVMCNVILPDADLTPARQQQRNFHAYLMHHGSALGALGALLRVGLISPVAYNELSARVRRTALATEVTR